MTSPLEASIGGDPARGGEAGSARETPHSTDPPEDLGSQDGTDAEQVRESAVRVLDRRSDLLVDACHRSVKPSYLPDQVHREDPASSHRTGRSPDVAQQCGGSIR